MSFFYNNRGLPTLNSNQYPLAIENYNQAIRLKPDDAGAYYNKGLAYTDLGQFRRAIENLYKAIHLKPDYADATTIEGLLTLNSVNIR